MQRSLKLPLPLALLLLQSIPLFVGAQEHQPQITEDKIAKHFSKSPECEGFDIDSLEYYDFDGGGNEEAVVVASTCATGTAGPDVHAVLRLLPDGSLAELKIPEPTDKQQASLFCRCFYDFNVKNGLLVATYHDQSGRDDPLVIQYRWNAHDKEFQVADVKMSKRYPTSFDCDKAKTSVENAICYSMNVAYLDVRVDRTYKNWLDKLNDADSDILMKEQKNWLRKRNLICGDDGAIVSCLETLYSARELELGHFRNVHPETVSKPPAQN